MYAFAEALGYSLIMIVLGTLSLKRAQKGNAKPWTLFFVALAIYALTIVGAVAGGFDGQDALNYCCVAAFTIFFYVRISQAVK